MHGDGSRQIGTLGQQDVEALLTESFPFSEISSEVPDCGTDFLFKVPAHDSEFFPVEWRIQVKATTRPALSVQMTTRRGELALANPSTHWLLFFVQYTKPVREISEMTASDRRDCTRYFVIDIRLALLELLANDPNALAADQITIVIPKENKINTNLLIHLWVSCLWNQVIGALRDCTDNDAKIISEIKTDLRNFPTLSSDFIRNVPTPLRRVPNVNSVIENADSAAKRLLKVPLHSYFGARIAINKQVNAKRRAQEMRGCSHLDKLSHVVCWTFAPWYAPFNFLALATERGLRRILHIGALRRHHLHERIAAWQMLKIQISHGACVTLTSDESLQDLQPETIFWPLSMSTTRLYKSGNYADTHFGGYDQTSDPIEWERLFRGGVRIGRQADLYLPSTLEALELKLAPAELVGRGVPSKLFHPWWHQAANGGVVLTQ